MSQVAAVLDSADVDYLHYCRLFLSGQSGTKRDALVFMVFAGLCSSDLV